MKSAMESAKNWLDRTETTSELKNRTSETIHSEEQELKKE
jgi:hypothetical protein